MGNSNSPLANSKTTPYSPLPTPYLYITVFRVIYQEEILRKSSILRTGANTCFKIGKIWAILTLGPLKKFKISEQIS